MEPTGIKFIVQRQDGAISTWHNSFDRKIEDILRDISPKKGWENGIVTEAYIEFDNRGQYYKVQLECSRLTKFLSI